jgi:hypothetical protein
VFADLNIINHCKVDAAMKLVEESSGKSTEPKTVDAGNSISYTNDEMSGYFPKHKPGDYVWVVNTVNNSFCNVKWDLYNQIDRQVVLRHTKDICAPAAVAGSADCVIITSK